MGLSSRGSQLEQAAEPPGLGFHVGETGLPRERRPVPAASHVARRQSRRQRRVLESSRSVGTQLPAASLVEYSLQPDRHHSLHFVYGQRAVGGHHAHEARANKLGRGHQAGRSRCGTLFLDGDESVAIRARGLRHARILWQFRAASSGDCGGLGARYGTDGDASAARRRTALPLLSAGSHPAFEGLHAERAAFQRIFLVGCGGPNAGSGAHRLHRRLLYGGKPLWSLGAAGPELFGYGQHDVPVDRGGGHRADGLDKRRISVSLVCDTVCRTHDQVTHSCRHPAGVFLEFSAQRVSAGARLHPRDRGRHHRRRCRHRDVALGHRCDAHLALHRGCIARGIAAHSFEQPVFQDIRRGGRRRRACPLSLCLHFVFDARGV